MRKELIASARPETVEPDAGWLDLDTAARVQVTSEEKGYPIERALVENCETGWRAASDGTQTIRLIFDRPQKLERIWLLFEDREHTRTQEFLLRWSADNGRSFQDIARQQWNFSPPYSTRESEDYRVELADVTTLELLITPDKSGANVRASLACLRLAKHVSGYHRRDSSTPAVTERKRWLTLR